MTSTYTVRPISDRSEFTGRHRDSQFDSTWTQTEDLLLREVTHLAGRNLVLEIDVREFEIRNDGRPYARARAATPAVRVAFESKHGPLTYATDRFWEWQDNARAIALGLEALRKIERYGIAGREQQYTGFKALPAGRAMPASHMTSDQAYDTIFRLACGPAGDPAIRIEIARNPDALASAYREARIKSHPDRHGGDHTLSDKLLTARNTLGML